MISRLTMVSLFSALLGWWINDNRASNVGLTALLDMTGDRPFMYRLLLPQTAKGIAMLLGLSPYLVARVLAGLCLFGAYLAFERLTHHLGWQERPMLGAVLWCVGLASLTVFGHVRIYAYDPLTLLSFTLAILALAKMR